MSDAERTGIRSLIYSGWHRRASIARFVGQCMAAKLCMIDIDACEYCCFCGRPVALIETQESESTPKPARVMTALALMAGIPAFSVSVTVHPDTEEPSTFQVQQLSPSVSDVITMLPGPYAYWLWSLRDRRLHGDNRDECAALQRSAS